jgi:hypothetical protein
MSMSATLILTMVRRTVTLPESIDRRVRELAFEGESFSAAVARLLEAGTREVAERRYPSYVGTGEGGPPDLGINAEKYLEEIARESEHWHEPGKWPS